MYSAAHGDGKADDEEAHHKAEGHVGKDDECEGVVAFHICSARLGAVFGVVVVDDLNVADHLRDVDSLDGNKAGYRGQ